ncbi:MAG: DNA adenine methylase [Actinobacteria bacterium]|nr:DNA adenine methylase [Actinomycetota bacterium]
MIKYLGSKRRLAPVLGTLLERSGAVTALDLFTGTTRVAQELKRRGARVTAVDTARYAHQFARCYVESDSARVDVGALAEEVRRLDALPGRRGYVTRTFCEAARYFQPHNGMRIDAIRDAIDADHTGSTLRPLLLTSLIEAADRVDSTTGVQMAYLKRWSPRSHGRLQLRVPRLLAGPGLALRADAVEVAARLPPVDFAYLDPPYNQHRYFTNYHVWETLVAWDAPDHYGVACKRADCRRPSTASPFNFRRAMPAALARVVASVRARLMVVSCNDEAWVGLPQLTDLCAARGRVAVLAFDSRRYVGAQIGIHDLRGRKVGRVSHLRNTEYLVLSGDGRLVERALRGFPDAVHVP